MSKHYGVPTLRVTLQRQFILGAPCIEEARMPPGPNTETYYRSNVTLSRHVNAEIPFHSPDVTGCLLYSSQNTPK